jgi:hypothetical protein
MMLIGATRKYITLLNAHSHAKDRAWLPIEVQSTLSKSLMLIPVGSFDGSPSNSIATSTRAIAQHLADLSLSVREVLVSSHWCRTPHICMCQ